MSYTAGHQPGSVYPENGRYAGWEAPGLALNQKGGFLHDFPDVPTVLPWLFANRPTRIKYSLRINRREARQTLG